MLDHLECPPVLPCCDIDETWSGRTVVLAVSGTLDTLTSGDLEEAIDTALAKHPSALVVDLTDVDFLASHGMNVLVAAHFRAGSDVRVVAVADGPITARPLALVGVAEIVAVYPTREMALARLSA